MVAASENIPEKALIIFVPVELEEPIMMVYLNSSTKHCVYSSFYLTTRWGFLEEFTRSLVYFLCVPPGKPHRDERYIDAANFITRIEAQR